MTSAIIFNQLRILAPSVAFSVSRTLDPFFVWDGDGPAPEDSEAYDVDVVATAVVRGCAITADASMGGSYFADDELIGCVHGYLPQMLCECATDLMGQSGTPDGIREQLALVVEFLGTIDVGTLID